MPATRSQVFDGQTDFSGGMVMLGEPPSNGYRFSKNMVVRTGHAMTRPGMHAMFRDRTAGFQTAFYFNQDNARLNDSAHTGFWFDKFWFVGALWGTIQGMGVIKFATDTVSRMIVVSGGKVFVHENGEARIVPTQETVTTDERISFIQVTGWVYMFRGSEKSIMRWNGTSAGFVVVTTTGATPVPKAESGTYLAGRMWIAADGDNLYASDVADPTMYDAVYQTFGISSGDGDSIVRVLPFHSDNIIVFKGKTVHAVSGVNMAVQSGTHLSDYVNVQVIDSDFGLIAERAVVIYGEQIAWLSRRGICNIQRNQYNNLSGVQYPMSGPIQPIIDRINWSAASVACATYFDNYLFFAVPLDGKTYNSAVLVYDLLLNEGQGAWVSVWESEMLRPVSFYEVDMHLCCLGNDGILRRMMTDDPWDTEDPYADTRLHDTSRYYELGEHCTFTPLGGTLGLYESIQAGKNHLPTDVDYWELIPNPNGVVYQVESELHTRHFRHGDPTVQKQYGVTELIYEGQNPCVSIKSESESNYKTLSDVLSNIEYDRTKYEIANTSDWDPTNINDDFDHPYRQDYSVMLPQEVYGRRMWDPGQFSQRNLMSPMSLAVGDQVVVNIVGNFTHTNPPWTSVLIFKIGIPNQPASLHELGTVILPVSTPTSVNIQSLVDITIAGSYVVYCTISTASFIGLNSLYVEQFTNWLNVPTRGVDINIWTPHSVRFITLPVKSLSVGLRLYNTHGRLKVRSIKVPATLQRHTERNV